MPAISTTPITLSAETSYASRTNIAYPDTQARATVAEAAAAARINDALPTKDVVTVSPGAIKVSN